MDELKRKIAKLEGEIDDVNKQIGIVLKQMEDAGNERHVAGKQRVL